MSKYNKYNAGEIAAAGLFTAFLVAGFGAAAATLGLNPIMTDKDGTERAVQAEHPNWTNVKATGYGWLSCGFGEHGDLWRTRYTATNEAGKPVKGVACAGIVKAPTLRNTN